jgi:hypothetical protein
MGIPEGGRLARFKMKYRNESSKGSARRIRAREERQRPKSADELAEKELAYLDAYQAIVDKTATPEQRRLFLSVEEGPYWRERGIELSQRVGNRLFDGGNVWPDGLLARVRHQACSRALGRQHNDRPLQPPALPECGKVNARRGIPST